MFENYPKSRPVLPSEYQQLHKVNYKLNRQGQTIASTITKKVESWMHKKVASDIKDNKNPGATLELGAGILNQLPFESNTKPYDIVEPVSYFYENSPHLNRVRKIYEYIEDIPISNKYERILSIATFEHICDLPQVVAKCGLLLNKFGHLRVAIPSEGTPIWTMAWKFTTGLEFKLRYKLDYGVIMKHEHVNSAEEVEEILSYFFDSINYKALGISKKLSILRFYDCSIPNIKRCTRYLKGLSE